MLYYWWGSIEGTFIPTNISLSDSHTHQRNNDTISLSLQPTDEKPVLYFIQYKKYIPFDHNS